MYDNTKRFIGWLIGIVIAIVILTSCAGNHPLAGTGTDAVLIDPRVSQLGYTIHPAPDGYAVTNRRIKAVWITVFGNWNDVPDWARQWQQDTLGGDHHAFGTLYDLRGDVAQEAGFALTWPGQADTDIKIRTPHPDGWANDELWAGYNWRDTEGPYCWQTGGNAEKFCGMGMPYPQLPWEGDGMSAMGGVHVTWFVVWEMTPGQTPTPEPTVTATPEPTSTPEPSQSCWFYLGEFWRCLTK